MKNIQVISPFSDHEPIHRMKIKGIENALGQKYNFSNFVTTFLDPDCLIINCLHLNWIDNEEFIIRLNSLKNKCLIMLFLADFYPESINQLKKWDKYIDIFIVPTDGLKNFVEIFTEKKVKTIKDPIDFCATQFKKPIYKNSKNVKVVWFGFPESYDASLRYFEDTLYEIRDEIEFHIITNIENFRTNNAILHNYDPDTFLNNLRDFDVCLLSHLPLNFFVGNLFKSENKAVLAISQGLPVIASDTPAYKNLLEKCNLSDYLFRTKDQLKRQLLKLAEPDNRVRYLEAAIPYVISNYTIDRIAKDWDEIFQSEYSAKFCNKSL